MHSFPISSLWYSVSVKFLLLLCMHAPKCPLVCVKQVINFVVWGTSRASFSLTFRLVESLSAFVEICPFFEHPFNVRSILFTLLSILNDDMKNVSCSQ